MIIIGNNIKRETKITLLFPGAQNPNIANLLTRKTL